VRQRIEKSVLVDNLITSPIDQSDVEEEARVARVRLGPGGQEGLRVWGGARLCGMHNCPVWIFDRTNGGTLLDGGGYEMDFRRTLHHGLYDIEIKAGQGAIYGERNFYEFDGKRYQQVRSVVFKY